MFIQQMDDINSFEKNHGRVRGQIFMQNQKAESETQQKDTLNIFSALILFLVDSSKTVKSGIY